MDKDPFPPEQLDRAIDYFKRLFPMADFVILAYDHTTGISRPVTSMTPSDAIGFTAELLEHMRSSEPTKTEEGRTH